MTGLPPSGADAYLDIETSDDERITVVGMSREDRGFLQLVAGQITRTNIMRFLEGIGVLHTYNGHRFDLPVIREALGLDLRRAFTCRDLMYDCWRLGLFGGFKNVERRLGVPRTTEGVDGMAAMRLWRKYVDEDDRDALDLLLLYNREDVENLALVKKRLGPLGVRAPEAGP